MLLIEKKEEKEEVDINDEKKVEEEADYLQETCLTSDYDDSDGTSSSSCSFTCNIDMTKVSALSKG